MSVEVINPEGLTKPDMYRQVAVATGTRFVFIAGQVARDADGRPVGAGDLAAQTEQAFRNVAVAIEAVGGSFADIAKLTVYVVDWSPEKMAALGEGAMRAAGDGRVDPLKPITLIGVAALGEPDLLIEIEATAVLPDGPAAIDRSRRSRCRRSRCRRSTWPAASPPGHQAIQ